MFCFKALQLRGALAATTVRVDCSWYQSIILALLKLHDVCSNKPKTMEDAFSGHMLLIAVYFTLYLLEYVIPAPDQ